MAAVNAGEKGAAYSKLIEYQGSLPDEVKQKTGITEEMLRKKGVPLREVLKEFVAFVGDDPIVGFLIDDIMELINEKLEEASEPSMENSRYNLHKYVKKEKMFLSDYRLESVLAAYDIKEQISYRALADAQLIYNLAIKVNKFQESLVVK